MPPFNLNDLPPEIISAIISYLDPPSFLNLHLTSRLLHTTASHPLHWRLFTLRAFQHWDPRTLNLSTASTQPVDSIPWKRLYIARRTLAKRVKSEIDSIVNNVTSRIDKIEGIVGTELGIGVNDGKWAGNWDVKDALIEEMRCPDEAEDVLARRFWAGACQERLHRARAIGIWAGAREEEPGWVTFERGGVKEAVPLEAHLAAFDMFVDGCEAADAGDITTLLDAIATRFSAAYPESKAMSIRQRAVTLGYYLREVEGFRGVTTDDSYYNLPNNFLGRALRDPSHPALPLVCVVIYCAVARRIGIDAAPTGFPMHVYAVVQAQSLDNHPVVDEAPIQRMYIDAFRAQVEVPLTHLQAQLRAMNASPTSDAYLGPATPSEILLRTARNILYSARMAAAIPPNTINTSSWPDIDTARYAAHWVSVLLGSMSSHAMERDHSRHSLRDLVETLQSQSPWDISLLTTHLLPSLLRLPEYSQLIQITHVVRAADKNLRPMVRREGQAKEGVRYKVGMVFKHKRFRYQGVVVGWDVQCDATEEWCLSMGVDGLGRGRGQAFYHVLAEDKSNRYVAEDNIHPTNDEPKPSLLKLAGRYFRRWDAETRMFVSNIREEYPDD